MRFKISIFLITSMFMACDDSKEEIDMVEPEEISLEVNIPEIELKSGIIPINVKVSGTDSTSILLDGVEIYESIDSVYEFNLNTENYNDGVYTLTVVAGKSAQAKFEQEIEIFNKLMTYELLDEELDRTGQDSRWRIIVLTTLDGDFLDYKIMESAGTYEFERPEGFVGEEFTLYFFRKSVSPFRTTLIGNAFDIKTGKWGTSPLPEHSNTAVREQKIQLTDFENEPTRGNLSISSREHGLIRFVNNVAMENQVWDEPNFPVDFSFLDVFLYSNGNNAADLYHAEFSSEQISASDPFEISRNNFTVVNPIILTEVPNNLGFTYNARVVFEKSTSEIFSFRENSPIETFKSYDLGAYYENYQHNLEISLNDEQNTTLGYTFKNENMPTQLPPINFSFDNVQVKSDEVSFSNSGDEGLITISFLNRIERETNLRLFMEKNYNANISVKLPDWPQEIIEFEPLFAQYNNNTLVSIIITNEPILSTPFKLFLSMHGRTNERNFESNDTRSLSISTPIN